MIEHNDRQHLLPAFVTYAAKCYAFLSRMQSDREAHQLFLEGESLIRRHNESTRGTGERGATVEGGSQ